MFGHTSVRSDMLKNSQRISLECVLLLFYCFLLFYCIVRLGQKFSANLIGMRCVVLFLFPSFLIASYVLNQNSNRTSLGCVVLFFSCFLFYCSVHLRHHFAVCCIFCKLHCRLKPSVHELHFFRHQFQTDSSNGYWLTLRIVL